jgi:predicted Mrr-cat superfamily restriction endonuclease
MIPFIEKYNFNRYKKTPWKHNLPTGRYEKGKYFKIVPTQKIKLFRSENYYPRMIQLLTEQFIELYEDTNHRLRHYLLLEGQPKQDLLKEPQMKTILNQILYGPPGTGKTYTTIDKVVEICEPTEYVKNDHDANKEVYDRLIRDGRVEFTTFHQSMAYEDFIEGIKPVKPEDNDPFLKYDIEPGVFRRIAKSAEKLVHVNNHTVEWDKVRYFKMSIGGKNRPEIHDYCISKNMVGLGWGGDEDLSEVSDFKDWKTYRDTYIKLFPDTANENRYHIQASYIFNRVNIGDIVVVTKGNHIIDAIGKVIGNYEYNDQNPTGFYHFRKVEWITTNMDASPGKFFEKQISQQSIYEFYDEDVKKETFKELTSIEEKEAKPYVLVIDEINRGNVSAIFGELITLIEEDKRQGATNELFVTLPYSKKRFTVPSNLHIIGTMNTADRSVEALDTALRRRFSFVEMLPDPKLLSTKGTNGDGMIEDVNLQELLTTINSRIEVLIDRDHTIGHAFFINDKSIDDLKHTFKNKIIPLLQEYFYGNYEKMALVIGNSFFHIQDQKSVVFAETTNDYDLSNKIYTILDCTAEGFDFITAIQKLMNKTISQQTQVRTDSSYGDN